MSQTTKPSAAEEAAVLICRHNQHIAGAEIEGIIQAAIDAEIRAACVLAREDVAIAIELSNGVHHALLQLRRADQQRASRLRLSRPTRGRCWDGLGLRPMHGAKMSKDTVTIKLGDAALYACITILVLAFWGDPDLLEAIIQRLTR